MKPFEYFAALPFKKPITREEYEIEVAAESAIALAGRRVGKAECSRCGAVYVPGISHFGSDTCLAEEAQQAQSRARRVRCDARLVRHFAEHGIEVVQDYVLDYDTKQARLAPHAPWWALRRAAEHPRAAAQATCRCVAPAWPGSR